LTFKRVTLVALAFAAALMACSGDGPPQPYAVTATSLDGAADVRWSYGSTAGVGCFLIQRSEGGEYNFVDCAKVPPAQLYFHDDNVLLGWWYYYRIAAFYEEWDGQTNVLSEFSTDAGCLIE
jgi:hypothetical protein